MPAPTPNGPTLNDLEYASYNGLGSLNVTTYIPTYLIQTVDNARLSENVAVNFPDFTGSVDTSDFINTTESVVVNIAPNTANQYSINTSDTVTTSENMDILKAGARFVSTSDSATTSENVAVVEA